MTDPKFVIVTATKEQLFDIGMCSNQTFKWLMNGQPKKIKSIEYNAYGRRMFYLRGEDDNEISSWWGWVYEDMTEACDEWGRITNLEIVGTEMRVDLELNLNVISEPIDINRIAHDYGFKRVEPQTAHGIIQNIATEEVTKKDFEGEEWKENAATAGKRLESNA